MRKINIHSFSATIILFSLLMHTALLHNTLTTSFICLEQDGNVRIEKMGKSNECSSNIVELTFNKNISNANKDSCADISLDINCDTDRQITQKQKDLNPNFITNLFSSKTNLDNTFKLNLKFNKLYLTNHHLSSYSTVSLLI